MCPLTLWNEYKGCECEFISYTIIQVPLLFPFLVPFLCECCCLVSQHDPLGSSLRPGVIHPFLFVNAQYIKANYLYSVNFGNSCICVSTLRMYREDTGEPHNWGNSTICRLNGHKGIMLITLKVTHPQMHVLYGSLVRQDLVEDATAAYTCSLYHVKV